MSIGCEFCYDGEIDPFASIKQQSEADWVVPQQKEYKHSGQFLFHVLHPLSPFYPFPLLSFPA